MSSIDIAAPQNNSLTVNADEALRSVLQGGSIRDLELTMLNVPGSGGTTWEAEGVEPTKKLVGVVIDDHSNDVVYLKSFEETGGGNAPDALWVDGEFQYANDDARAAGVRGVHVDSEPLNDYIESGPRIDNRWRIYLLTEQSPIPVIIDVPRMSRKAWFNFKVKAIGAVGRELTDVLLGFTLVNDRSKSGVLYSRIVTNVERVLTEEESAGARASAQAFKPLTRRSNTPATQSTEVREASKDLGSEFSAAGITVAPSTNDDNPF